MEARDELDFLQTKLDCCLVIDGESLQVRFPQPGFCFEEALLTVSSTALHRAPSHRVYRTHHQAFRRRGMSMLSYSKSRRRTSHSSPHKEKGLLYRRWRKRRFDDSSCGCWLVSFISCSSSRSRRANLSNLKQVWVLLERKDDKLRWLPISQSLNSVT